MAITKSTTIETTKAEVTIKRRGVDDDESITLQVCAADYGFWTMLHLSIDDAKAISAALGEVAS